MLIHVCCCFFHLFLFFFFNDTATTEIYTLSLHDALPILEKYEKLESEMKKVKQNQASSSSEDLMGKAVDIKGIKLLATKVDGANANALRSLMDNLKVKIKSGVIVLAAVEGNKVLLIAGVTNDLTDSFHAGKIIGRIAPIVGGKGGGRPDMAQAGGKEPSKINEASEFAKKIVEEVSNCSG